MIPDDEPTVQPPDSSEVFDDDVEKEKTVKKKSTTFDTPNNIPPSNENTTTFNTNKNKEKSPEIEIMTLKDPELPPNANNTMTQRTIEIVTAAVIVNHRITTPVTLQLQPSKGSTNLNVLKAHKNIFSAKINSHPPHWNTHQSSEISTKIQTFHEFIYRTKSKVRFHLVKSNTAIDNNYQISSIH